MRLCEGRQSVESFPAGFTCDALNAVKVSPTERAGVWQTVKQQNNLQLLNDHRVRAVGCKKSKCQSCSIRLWVHDKSKKEQEKNYSLRTTETERREYLLCLI